LQFQDVTFRYPTRREVAALHGFNHSVRPGETLAVVGPSGAGNLPVPAAQRFYDPESGAVRLDGIDLRDADPADVRSGWRSCRRRR
jgi:ATP-binding cassette subfamily B protein